MKNSIGRVGTLLLLAAAPLARVEAQVITQQPAYARVSSDSLAKRRLRVFVTELRDTLNRVQSVQDRIQRARAAKMPAVVTSLGRELGKQCRTGVTMIDSTTVRVRSGYVPTKAGEEALRDYGTGLASLRESLRLCSHYDSIAMATAPVDQERLENIASAARDAINVYDQVRDGFLRLLGISLPTSGKIWQQTIR